MRKLLFMLLALMAVSLTSCNLFEKTDPDTKPEKKVTITLTPVTATLKVGEMVTIDATGNTEVLEWTSSNDSVATVYYGVVTAKAIGYAQITAKQGSSTANCEVFVTGTDGATLRISQPYVSIRKGETFQFTCGNTYNLPVTWSSSDESVATIDQNGMATGLKPGVSTITLSSGAEEVTALLAVEHEWGDYTLVWSDEFNGSELDHSVWDYNLGGGGWGNNELQYYTNRPENIRVEDGMLKIEARKEEYENRHYTSARILSKGKKTFLYGRFEARIKFPGGRGTWPAYWMMGNQGGWPACGEIDIIEHIGSQPTRASFALHTPDKNGTKGNNWSKTKFFDYSLADDFHVYAVEWAQEENGGKDVIRFMVDDVVYAESWEANIDDPKSWPFNKEHFIIFNLAIGGNMGGSVDDAIFNQERIMYVDWVRVYQRQER